MHLHSVSIQLLLSDYVAIYSGLVDIRLIHVEAQRYEDARNEGYTPIFSALAAHSICKRTRLEASQILEFMDGLFSYTHAFSHLQVPIFVLRQQDVLSFPIIVENQEFEEYQQELNQRNRISALASVSVTEVELDGFENDNDEAYFEQGIITVNSYGDATADAQNPDSPPDYQDLTRLRAHASGYIEIVDDETSQYNDQEAEPSFQNINTLEAEEPAENFRSINDFEKESNLNRQESVYRPSSPIGNVYYYNKPLSPTYSVDDYEDENDDVLLLISSPTNTPKNSKRQLYSNNYVNTQETNDSANCLSKIGEEEEEDEVPIDGTTMTGDLLKGKLASYDSTPPNYNEQEIKRKNSKRLAQTDYPFHKKYQFKEIDLESHNVDKNIEVSGKNDHSNEIKNPVIQTVREIPTNDSNEDPEKHQSDLHQQPPQSISYSRSVSPTPNIWKRFFRKR